MAIIPQINKMKKTEQTMQKPCLAWLENGDIPQVQTEYLAEMEVDILPSWNSFTKHERYKSQRLMRCATLCRFEFRHSFCIFKTWMPAGRA